jgi:hypothetical protein
MLLQLLVTSSLKERHALKAPALWANSKCIVRPRFFQRIVSEKDCRMSLEARFQIKGVKKNPLQYDQQTPGKSMMYALCTGHLPPLAKLSRTMRRRSLRLAASPAQKRPWANVHQSNSSAMGLQAQKAQPCGELAQLLA